MNPGSRETALRAERERRRDHRRPYGSGIHWGTDELAPAQCVDLSVGGIGFVAQGTAEPGTEVEVAFLDRSVAVRGVVRSRRPVDGGHHMGVQFHADEREVVEVVLQVT